MAREESDREDLLREATAFVERIEFAPTDRPAADRVFIGFRADGAMSAFFGADPVYQFNAAGELRRAFCKGLLFKAMKGRLISLERGRQKHQVQLLRHELSEQEQARFLSQMRGRLREFVDQFNTRQLAVVGQVPAQTNVLGRVRNWFAAHESFPIARTPHASRS